MRLRSVSFVLAATTALATLFVAPEPARADSGRLHLHLDVGVGGLLAGQARPGPGETSAGGVGWLGIDWQLAPPFAIEAILGVGGFARPYPRSDRDGTRYTSFAVGARFRFLDEQAGYANEEGGDWPSHLWVSAHLGYHYLDRQQFGVDAAVGYALSPRRPLQMGVFLRTMLTFAGQHSGPDLALLGGIELTIEVMRREGALDSDGDGLPDAREVELGTDPNDRDTDRDGLDDRLESETGTDPLRRDSDDDGLLDGREDANRNGVLDDGETDPRRADTDGGGMPDPDEVRSSMQDPRNPRDDDHDGDGVANHLDECEDTPRETQVDGVGCAAGAHPATNAMDGDRFVLEGVTFASGSARILPESEAVLNQALESLRRRSELRFEIAGYTDDRGSARTNRRLSQQRANAVRDWLVEHGLERGRFETRGYGPASPIDSNDTPEGRARNRRIEFRRLE